MIAKEQIFEIIVVDKIEEIENMQKLWKANIDEENEKGAGICCDKSYAKICELDDLIGLVKGKTRTLFSDLVSFETLTRYDDMKKRMDMLLEEDSKVFF